MFSKFFQRLRHQACAVLFGIVLISACTVSAGAVVTEQSGDGMCFFNWMVAPELPGYRPSGYDYSLISYQPVDGMNAFTDYICLLLYSDVPLFFDGEYLKPSTGTRFSYVQYFYTPSFDVASILGISPGVWQLFDENNSIEFGVPRVNWSDYSVLNTSGDIISSYTEPISLDGFTLVRWDSDSSDLVSLGNYMYQVGNSISPVPSEAYFVTGQFTSNSVSFQRGVTVPDSFLSVDGDLWTLSYSSDGSPYVESNSSLGYLGFYKRAGAFGLPGTFTQLLAYKSDVVPIGPDFSQTSLIASNPQYDYQSAEFDISWSNLPEVPYPDNVQYFIQGRLNDGAASQPPEIYLGSSSDPPTSDVPVSFSFSGLQPETQYTATFELVYNTTGSFRDFIRSGVTTTVSFTTLSDGSISEGDKAIINAIQNANKDNQQWTDSQFGSAVGDLPQDTTETDSLISGLDQQEEAYKDEAYERFQELSSSFSGFDGSIGSGIGLAGTLFTRFYRALGSYQIIYTFPLLLGLAMVLIGRLGRSSIRIEREPGDQFKIDGW